MDLSLELDQKPHRPSFFPPQGPIGSPRKNRKPGIVQRRLIGPGRLGASVLWENQNSRWLQSAWAGLAFVPTVSKGLT
jgi:hypothetical protein